MRRTTHAALSIAAGLAALAVLGCGADFLPVTYLHDLRVLAIEANPLEVGPEDELSLRPVVFTPAERTVTGESWTFCPFSLGSQTGFACAVPICEQSLTPGPDGRLVSRPYDLALACVARFAGSEPPAGLPTELPESIEMTYAYRVWADDGSERTAVMRVPLYPAGAPAVRNRQPVLTAVEIAGQPAVPGQLLSPVAELAELEMRVLVDPDSLDLFVDPSGRQQREEPILSFFSTAGRFQYEREVGVDVLGRWTAEELEPGQFQADLYVVVRDLRGGQAVGGPYPVPILR
jgi:hypothetical protein